MTSLPTSSASETADVRRLIAERAYEIWENHGRPFGHDLMHWRQAEQEIISVVQGSAQRSEQPNVRSDPAD